MSADPRGRAAAARGAPDELSAGDHLRDEIERLGLDQVAVSAATGVSRQTINNIINGRQRVSRTMAGKLGRLTGRSSDYWLRESFPAVQARRRGGTPAPAAPMAGGVLVNHQILRAIKRGIIGIEPFSATNVQAASISLTLHNVVVTTDGKKIDIERGKGFLLERGSAVNVSTRESIGIPRDYVGRVGAAWRLGGVGIVTSLGCQIDPGFQGRLRFFLLNVGGAAYRLRGGEPIVSLEIMPLALQPATEMA